MQGRLINNILVVLFVTGCAGSPVRMGSQSVYQIYEQNNLEEASAPELCEIKNKAIRKLLTDRMRNGAPVASFPKQAERGTLQALRAAQYALLRKGKDQYFCEYEYVIKSFSNGSSYEGTMLGGKFHGDGTFVTSSGMRYEGEWISSKRTGKGKLLNSQGRVIYEGDFLDNEFHGVGDYTSDDGRRYSGQWAGGKRNGEGKVFNKEGKVTYSGGFKDNKYHGLGTIPLKNGGKLVGSWIDHKLNGLAITTMGDGSKWESEYVDSKVVEGTTKRIEE